MTPALVAPPKMARGGRVDVLSPSWAAPAHFPEIHEQAMRRLRDVVGVEPVEYPTTRRDSSPQDRANDLMAAFADTSIGAVLATIGGEDQITVLPYLEPDVIRRHPKPFLGYSDNTNLLNWLWRHGLAAFHGGSTQVHLGPGPQVASLHLRSLEAALFDGSDLEITPLTEFSEDGLDWGLAQALTDASPTRPAAPWAWHQPDHVVSAPHGGVRRRAGGLPVGPAHGGAARARALQPGGDGGLRSGLRAYEPAVGAALRGTTHRRRAGPAGHRPLPMRVTVRVKPWTKAIELDVDEGLRRGRLDEMLHGIP